MRLDSLSSIRYYRNIGYHFILMNCIRALQNKFFLKVLINAEKGKKE
jgi:hypothetical protein